MESDTSLTASTVSNFLLRFSKSNSPNGCSPRLLPAIRELGGQGARRTRLFSRPAYYSCLTARNQSAPGHSWGGGAPLFATFRGPSEPANIASAQLPQELT